MGRLGVIVALLWGDGHLKQNARKLGRDRPLTLSISSTVTISTSLGSTCGRSRGDIARGS